MSQFDILTSLWALPSLWPIFMVAGGPILTAAIETMAPIWARYKETLDMLSTHIGKTTHSEVPLINQVAQYTLNSGGKRIRPLLLAMSADLCGGGERAAVLTGGAVVEFVHTATLLHDDVLDGAQTRRGTSSARAVWGDHVCILVGDYLYTLAACQVSAMANFEINDLFSATCREMSEGETLQLVHNDDFDLTEETYLRIIDRKTASLLSAACRFGGIVAGASDVQKAVLSRFGRNVGLAFQVADDTLDYVADDRQLGKSLGKDLEEGKVTLPLLHLLAHCTPSEREQIVSPPAPETAPDRLHDVVAMMQHYGSITYALNRAEAFADDARSALSAFPDSSCRQALFAVADYVVHRDR